MKTDKHLKADVEAELAWEPSIAAAHVGVAAEGGVVTLTGHVRSHAEKSMIERVVSRVGGVNAIAMELEVRLAPELLRDDTDIALAVERALAWHAYIPQDRIKVKVENGWVTLDGELDWEFQRNAAVDIVRPLNGVRGLTNRLTLAVHATTSDVADRIGAALQRHAQLQTRGITVAVHGSTVTLKGQVDNWADRNAAQEAAWAAPGVNKVVNEILIQAQG